MRKTTICLMLALLPLLLSAQGRSVERTYVSTDKDVYVAGEKVWCSAFCVTPDGTLSKVSRVACLELHSADGLAATARIALEGGRGAGALELPVTLPTGNYRLIAYTAQNEAEEGYDYEGIAAKTLSVFNVASTERVKNGVEILSEEEYKERCRVQPGMTKGLALQWDDGRLTLTNAGGQPVSVSLSVWHDDGILTNDNPGIDDFMTQVRRVGPRPLADSPAPDYEGEVIRGRVVGFSEAMIPSLTGKYAFISSPSDKSDVYAAPIREDGSLVFYTANIYGAKECICEIEDIDPKLSCHIELVSPYVNPAVKAPRALAMSESLSEALALRSLGMQLDRRFAADTLFDFLPRRSDGLFDEDVQVRYILDDYTRFPTMEEVFTEFIPEIRVRRSEAGERELRVRLNELSGAMVLATSKALVMLDGVPVFDHEKILHYDPLLVEMVDIYPNTHFIGNRIFEGVVNFVTYKRNLPGFQFDGNARVVDYQGVCVPMAFTGEAVAGNSLYPDYRQTLCWHPLVQLEAGRSLEIHCGKPLYKGHFVAVAEGLDAAGNPVSCLLRFEIR